jgi:hypothetical protein
VNLSRPWCVAGWPATCRREEAETTKTLPHAATLALALAATLAAPGVTARDKDRWQTCAHEGFVRRFDGEALVRYGTDGRCNERRMTDRVRCGDEGRFVEREVRGGIACTNEALGHDPVPGEIKRCDVTRS